MVWLNIQFQKGNGSRQFCFLSLSVSTSYQHICLSARLSLSGLPHYSTAYFKKMCNFRSKVTLSLKLKQQRICDNSTIMIVYPHKNCVIANSHPDSFAPPPILMHGITRAQCHMWKGQWEKTNKKKQQTQMVHSYVFCPFVLSWFRAKWDSCPHSFLFISALKRKLAIRCLLLSWMQFAVLPFIPFTLFIFSSYLISFCLEEHCLTELHFAGSD